MDERLQPGPKGWCYECGDPATQDHHIVPKSVGGQRTIPLCDKCHGKAHFRASMATHLTREALRIKKENGERLGRPPFGWRVVGGVLEEHPEQQIALRRVFELVASNPQLGSRAQSRALKQEGISLSPMTITRVLKRGADWKPETSTPKLQQPKERVSALFLEETAVLSEVRRALDSLGKGRKAQAIVMYLASHYLGLTFASPIMPLQGHTWVHLYHNQFCCALCGVLDIKTHGFLVKSFFHPCATTSEAEQRRVDLFKRYRTDLVRHGVRAEAESAAQVAQ